MSSGEYFTATEVGQRFDCSPYTITAHATRLGIGFNLGGRAGWRFTDADVAAIERHLREESKGKAPTSGTELKTTSRGTRVA